MGVNRLSRRALLYGPPTAGAAILVGPPEAAQAAPVPGMPASPKDFGAAGDGVTDDTAALNQCLAASHAVDFGGPANVYLITGTVLVQRSSPQVLIGYGATIKAGAGINLMRLKNAGHTVGGLRFDGNGQSAGQGLIVEPTAQRCLIERCTFTGIAGSGINVQNGAHFTWIIGCTLDGCGHGSSVAAPFHTSIFVSGADHCSVLDNQVLQCNWGIYFRGADAATGINFYNCRGNTLICATSAPAAAQGISNGYGRTGRIDNNTIIGFTDNSIDCFGCRDMVISGNNTQGGKDGVFVGDEASSGITITGNSFRSPHRGVRVLSGHAGRLIEGVVIANNSVAYPSDGGVLVQETGTAQLARISVCDNNLAINAAGSYGVKVINAELTKVSGNHIYRSRAEGIYLEGADIVQVTGNTVQDASTGAANTYDAIRLVNSTRTVLRDNVVYGSARYALGLTGGSGNTVSGTRWRSLGTGGISNQANGTVLSDNVEF